MWFPTDEEEEGSNYDDDDYDGYMNLFPLSHYYSDEDEDDESLQSWTESERSESEVDQPIDTKIIAEVVSVVHESGRTALYGVAQQLPLSPKIVLKGESPLTLPVNETVSAKMIVRRAVAQNATTAQAFPDLTLNNTWQVAADQIEFDSQWTSAMASLAEDAGRKLGARGLVKVSATFERLLLVEKGGHLAKQACPTPSPPHAASAADGDSHGTVLGTLLVQLPSVYVGGLMHVQPPNDIEATYDFGAAAGTSSTHCHFLAHTAAVKYETTPLISGYCVLLQYTLRTSAPPTPGAGIGASAAVGAHAQMGIGVGVAAGGGAASASGRVDAHAGDRASDVAAVSAGAAQLPPLLGASGVVDESVVTGMVIEDNDQLRVNRLYQLDPPALVAHMAKLLVRHRLKTSPFVPLVFFLDEVIPSSSLSEPGFSALRGRDAHVFQLLVAANALLAGPDKLTFMLGNATRRVEEDGYQLDYQHFHKDSSGHMTDTTDITPLHLLDGRRVPGTLQCDWSPSAINCSFVAVWRKPDSVIIRPDHSHFCRTSIYTRTALVVFHCPELSALALPQSCDEQIDYFCDLTAAVLANSNTISRDDVLQFGKTHLAWLLDPRHRISSKATPSKTVLKLDTLRTGLALGDVEIANTLLRLTLEVGCRDRSISMWDNYWQAAGRPCPSSFPDYVFGSPLVCEMVAKFGLPALTALLDIEGCEILDLTSPLTIYLVRLASLEHMLQGLPALVRVEARDFIVSRTVQRVLALLETLRGIDIRSFAQVSLSLDSVDVATKVCALIPTAATETPYAQFSSKGGLFTWNDLFKWLTHFAGSPTFVAAFLEGFDKMFKVSPFMLSRVLSLHGAGKLPDSLQVSFVSTVMEHTIAACENGKIDFSVSINALAWLRRRRRPYCQEIYRVQGKKLVDVWLGKSSNDIASICGLILASTQALQSCSLLLPLYERRASDLRARPGVVAQGTFSWAMPDARVPRLPEFEKFLHSDKEWTYLGDFGSLPMARTYARTILSASTPTYTTKALEPVGRGKNTCVKVYKTQDWALQQASRAAEFRRELEKIEAAADVIRAAVKARKASGSSGAEAAVGVSGDGTGAGPAEEAVDMEDASDDGSGGRVTGAAQAAIPSRHTPAPRVGTPATGVGPDASVGAGVSAGAGAGGAGASAPVSDKRPGSPCAEKRKQPRYEVIDLTLD